MKEWWCAHGATPRVISRLSAKKSAAIEHVAEPRQKVALMDGGPSLRPIAQAFRRA